MKGNRYRRHMAQVRRTLSVRKGTGMLLLTSLLFAIPTEGVSQDSPPQHRSATPVDHSVFDRLLKEYVDETGLVNYKAWKSQDEETLGNYLKSLGEIDSERLGRTEKIAFWVNAYNALTIRGILEFYPVKSIRDKVSRFLGFNIWDDYPMTVKGRSYSLNYIEHKILRKMDEPRIHFAIVCASVGCPKLRDEAYTGAKMNVQLEEQAEHFFAQPRNFRIDRERNKVYLSSILDWFGEDFGGSDREKLDFVSKYLSKEKDRDFLRSGKPKVKYLNYDWSLNEQKEVL